MQTTMGPRPDEPGPAQDVAVEAIELAVFHDKGNAVTAKWVTENCRPFR